MDYEFRLLTHDDYEEVKEMCKDIWDGTDYMPLVFPTLTVVRSINS